MINEDEENQMRTKLEFYFQQKTLLHISCSSGKFYNGKILDITSEKKLLVFKDKKLGAVPILFEEITKFEPYEKII